MLTDRISKFKSEFLPGLHTELRAQKSLSSGVSMIAGNLTGNNRSERSGVCARVYKNGVYGFASSAVYDDETVRNVIKAAGDNAVFMTNCANIFGILNYI